jgi:glyoxylase-like metal-dependent hydrolase (beta-lactamase superfamily II)
MKTLIRSLAVAVAVGLAGVAVTARAQQQDYSKVEIKVTKVSGNVYFLEGAGGNIAASVGDDGIVIVDDQFAPLAEKIRAALKGITDKPLRFIINTHYHFDHTGGNLPLHDATIIAQDNVRKRLAQANVVGNGGSAMKMDQPANPKEALPVITFGHDVTLHVNGEDIRALHAPSGHTDGDSIVFFPKSNVVHFGDDFVRYGFPFIDINGGGSSKGMIAALENAMTVLPKDVKVIPGHGALATLDDVRPFVTMLKETRAVVEKGVKAGKTLQQLQQEKVLAQWDKQYSGQFVSTDLFIETLYNELTGKKTAALVKH